MNESLEQEPATRKFGGDRNKLIGNPHGQKDEEEVKGQPAASPRLNNGTNLLFRNLERPLSNNSRFSNKVKERSLSPPQMGASFLFNKSASKLLNNETN